jgi:hypothetical protein
MRGTLEEREKEGVCVLIPCGGLHKWLDLGIVSKYHDYIPRPPKQWNSECLVLDDAIVKFHAQISTSKWWSLEDYILNV